MKTKTLNICGINIEIIIINTVIVGSGCAGFNAADWLYSLGNKDLMLVTEGLNMGTSRNAGSDKQTYYKSSICGDDSDSINSLAQTLFSGGSVNGDTALSEAAGSLQSFFKLVNLGVPFPRTRFGEYTGYKTDHDPIQRATSAGPLTSKFMTEALEREVKSKNIPIADNIQAIKIITKKVNDVIEVVGLLAVDKTKVDDNNHGLILFCCKNIVWATGGPAGIYLRSVYPKSQSGATGIPLEAGAKGCNLQEWQYGLASIKFRWNVSGTYQQVLPRYFCVEQNGEQREFLYDYFDCKKNALSMVFLKGYQWPFDVRKLEGSSLIDLIIYNETVVKGNRVYMDYTKNPEGLNEDFTNISEEAYEYLSKSNALFGTPIDRLGKMNPQAIELYKLHGIDLHNEPLEVCVCAQHHNGGLLVDAYWQSNIKGLFPVGEAAGTFGIYRPGGSALNSTQVGSLRAAQYISAMRSDGQSDFNEFCKIVEEDVSNLIENITVAVSKTNDDNSIVKTRLYCQSLMSDYAGHIRNDEEIDKNIKFFNALLEGFWDNSSISNPYQLPELFINRDLILTSLACLNAMKESAITAKSRGSALVIDEKGLPINLAFPQFKAMLPIDYSGYYLETEIIGENNFKSVWRKVRPIPQEEAWFENIWQAFREKQIF